MLLGYPSGVRLLFWIAFGIAFGCHQKVWDVFKTLCTLLLEVWDAFGLGLGLRRLVDDDVSNLYASFYHLEFSM